MFGSGILEVAIGILFVFLLVSLLCSALREGIEAWTRTRAAYLERGIRELLQDELGQGLASQFFNHPLIFCLYPDEYRPGSTEPKPRILSGGGNLPSYIPARNFALALLDIAARGPQTDLLSTSSASPVLSLAGVRANIANLDNPAVQRVLLTAIDTAQGNLDEARANIEAWYDSGMERVSSWYKRSTQSVILAIAIVVAGAGNINTLTIANYLYNNETARAAIVERAKAAVANPDILQQSSDQTKKDLAELQLPVGWANGPIAWTPPKSPPLPRWQQGLVAVFGCLLTAFAGTLGAPFWFDVLKRVMTIRAAVKPDDTRPEPRPAPATAARPRTPVPGAAGSAENAGEQAFAPRDLQQDIDCCGGRDLAPEEETRDEDLPPATGGVA
jgi:hypothetical protein